MLAQYSYDYIKIGLALRLLRNVSSDNDAGFILDTIDSLRELLISANFKVSMAATRSIEYNAMLVELRALDVADLIGDARRDQVINQFTKLESVVFPEALTKMIYVLPERRFNAEFLLNTPEKLMKDGAFDKLAEIAKSDLHSACRCILFGEATAAAFHILRATESVLKSYYFHHRRQNRLDKPMWAGMVDQLKAKTRNKPPATLLASLDMIRTGYRNPTQHPEAVYQIDSAQDLFGVCLDVIGKMAEEL